MVSNEIGYCECFLRGNKIEVEAAADIITNTRTVLDKRVIDETERIKEIRLRVSNVNSDQIIEVKEIYPEIWIRGILWSDYYYYQFYSRAGNNNIVDIRRVKYGEEVPDTTEYDWWGKDDFLEIKENSNGTVCILGYYRWDQEVKIPKEINGKPVTDIGDKAFYGNNVIEKIYLPDSIETVGKDAFSRCAALTVYTDSRAVIKALEGKDVAVICSAESDKLLVIKKTYKYSKKKNGVEITKYIGETSEEGIDLTIPEEIDGEQIVGIKKEAFVVGESWDNKLKINKLVIPDTVEKIGEYAFAGTGVKNVQLPASIKTLGYSCFDEDAYAPDFYIPDGLREVDVVTHNEKSICNYLVSEENPWYTSIDGILYSFKGKHLCKAPSNYCLKEVIIPEGVERIGASAFASTKVECVILPESLKFISNRAFWDCRELKKIRIPDGIVSIAYDAFLINSDSSDGSNKTYLEELEYDGKLTIFKKEYFSEYNIKRFVKRYIYHISTFDKCWKDMAAINYIKNNYKDDKLVVTKDKIRGYERYIKSNRKKFFVICLTDSEIMSYLLDNKIIQQDDIDEFLETANSSGASTEVVSRFLQYCKDNFEVEDASKYMEIPSEF